MFGKKAEPEVDLGELGSGITTGDRMRIDGLLKDKYRGGAEEFLRDLQARPRGALMDMLDAIRDDGTRDMFVRRYWNRLPERGKFEAICLMYRLMKTYEKKVTELGGDPNDIG